MTEKGGQQQFKRNAVVSVLGYLQLLPRGIGAVVLNVPSSKAATQDSAENISGTEVAAALRKSITALYAEFVTVDGSGVDYSALRASEEYKEYVTLSTQLTSVDPLTMDRNEKLAFFINVYNSLTIHAIAALGGPADLLSRLRMYAEASYQIGPNVYSLNDIENGVLRGNQAPPTINPFPKVPFKKNDPRAVFACKKVDPRIHFALNCAARGCPPIRFYKPETVLETLDTAAKAFCSSVEIEETPTPQVKLSQIFEWYAGDFAPDGEGSSVSTLEFVAKFVGESKKASLHRILDKKDQLKDVVTFVPYDWGLNSK